MNLWPWRRDIYDREGTTLYLVRWTLLKLFDWKLYLHKIVRADDDPCFHDHPWHFMGVVFKGGYVESYPDGSWTWRKPLSFFYHKPEFTHRIASVAPGGSWTLALMGPRIRSWGFVSLRGAWRYWRDHIDSGYGRVSWCETATPEEEQHVTE